MCAIQWKYTGLSLKDYINLAAGVQHTEYSYKMQANVLIVAKTLTSNPPTLKWGENVDVQILQTLIKHFIWKSPAGTSMAIAM